MRKLFKCFLCSFILCFCFYSLHLTKNTLSLSNNDPFNEFCVDYFIIFARGSGESLHTNIDHQAFQRAITDVFKKLPNLSYRYYQLGESTNFGDPYPAIGIEDPKIISGAILSGGKAYEFGQSVKAGINELVKLYRNITKSCPNTHFILSGYSQGAMVMTYAIRHLNPEKILYLANFGDPKLYLPEGRGIIPDACQNLHFSPYRQNVPDCYVEHGVLGGLNPYIYKKYQNKVGVWCNVADFICGSTFDPLGLSDPTQNPENNLFARIFNGHVSYSRRGAYTQAAKIIYQKIIKQHENQEKIIQDSSLIYYYHPNQLTISPSFSKLYQNNTHSNKREYQNNELVIMLPTFPTDPGDARDYLLLNQLFDKSYNHHFSIHLYLYGFFPVDLPDSPIYFPQKLDQNAPQTYKQGVRYIAGVNTTDMSPEGWDQLIKNLRNRIHNPPNINLQNLINSSLYDVIKNTPWSTQSNHLLFLLTPNQTSTFSHSNDTANPIHLVDEQIRQKKLSTFVYNFNQSLHKYFSSFNSIESKHLFNIRHSSDDIIQEIIQTNQSLQVDQIIKPRFDYLDLSYSMQGFSILNTTNKTKRLYSNTRSTYLRSTALSQPLYQWTINQKDQQIQYQTSTARLHLPIQSLTPQQVQLVDQNKQIHQTSLTFLPKPFSPSRSSDNLTFTIFPYRLIIIDDYIAGFTNQKHLTFKNVDPTSSHTIQEVELSSLGRIIKRKTTIIKKQNSHIAAKENPTNIPHISSKNTTKPSLKYSDHQNNSEEKNLINKLPNCGVKTFLPVPETKYFTAYFY